MDEGGRQVAAEEAPRPRLLRDEVFRARVLPEWYRPVPGMRPLSPGSLTALGVLLIAGLALVLATVTHERSESAKAVTLPPGLHCRAGAPPALDGAAATCLLVLRIDAQARIACPDGTPGDRVHLAGARAGAMLKVLSCTRGQEGTDLQLSIPVNESGPWATEPVEVALTRKRSLLGWLVSSLKGRGDTA